MKIFSLFIVVFLVIISINLVLGNNCDGCEFETTCYEFGEVVDGSYCNFDSSDWALQKGFNESCINDFECLDNLTCSDGICFNLIEGLISLDNISNQLNDSDGDFILNLVDNCLDVPNYDQANPDGDLFGSACDNCPNVPNNDQNDSDGDGVGDMCSSESDDDDDDGDDDASDSSGGSGSTYNTYTINSMVFSNGYTVYLRKGDKVKFKIDGVYHTLEVKNIEINNVDIEIKSKVFNTKIFPNQLQKFDVTSNGYYDLGVLLVSVFRSKYKAKITIKSLNEKAPGDTSSDTVLYVGDSFGSVDGTRDEEIDGVLKKTNLKVFVWVILLVCFVLILAALSILLYSESQKHKKQKKVVNVPQENFQKRINN